MEGSGDVPGRSSLPSASLIADDGTPKEAAATATAADDGESESGGGGGGRNPYLEMRAAKIARNRLKLRSLGLLKSGEEGGGWGSSSAARSASASAGTSREEGGEKHSSAVATAMAPLLPSRKSARLAGVKVSYREVPSALTDPPAPSRRGTSRKRARATADEWRDRSSADRRSSDAKTTAAMVAGKMVTVTVTTTAMGTVKAAETVTATASLSSHAKPSSRTTAIHAGTIVDRHLGREAQRFGKAAVVEEAVRASREKEDGGLDSVGGSSCGNISFNKYSGVCEWKNDAIFLWVNIANPGADVVNDFLDGGKKMTWFGGARMHDETPAIRRLIKIGRDAAVADRLSPRDGIVLWCRMYDGEKHGFRPYTCLGRVSYHSHRPGTRPIQFVWNLLDLEALKSRNAMGLKDFVGA